MDIRDLEYQVAELRDRVYALEELMNGEHTPTISACVTTDSKVRETLAFVGVPTHLSGYEYLVEAIKMVVCDWEIRKEVTTILYPSVADKFDTTSSRVERAIRHAIEVVFDNNYNADTVYSMFGNTISTKKGYPTNSHFISAVAEYVKR